MAVAGFCIGGIDWSRPELAGVEDPSQRLDIRRRLIADEARMTRELGGNLMRLFFHFGPIFGDSPGLDLALGSHWPTLPDDAGVGDSGLGMHRMTVPQRIERLDRCGAALDALLDMVAREELDFSSIDVVVEGVEQADEDVRLLLTFLAPVPRWIVEAPSQATLAGHGRDYSFASLWQRYLEINESVHRMLVRRYAGRPVGAYEVGNEPDYIWVPEDMKIEGSSEALLYPLAKYVTELQLGQVPEREELAPAIQAAPWGYQDQDAEWVSAEPRSATPLISFDWGRKFNWYVGCFAQLQERLARAIHEEAAATGAQLEIVSGSVTHNNIDYLLRMHRANPQVFEHVTRIGLHPYHWVQNDVWDARFVREEPTGGWTEASPREYARAYFKRFDFLQEVARYVAGKAGHRRQRDLRDFSKALRGKRLWITEFGIGSKVMGVFNAPIAAHTRFIRPRAGVGLAAGHGAAVWEDLWESFLDQVDREYLDANAVDAVLVYSLREAGLAGLDMHDDDRSNMALLHRNGSPRLERATLDRLHGLLASLTGRPGPTQPAAPAPGARLHSRPWRERSLSQQALEVTTMLSIEERQLLAWLTAQWWEGAGAIVDGGCFMGGSTLPLAEGLRENERTTAKTRIDVFDLFEVEQYMVDPYFSGRLQAGESFRGEFERATADVSDLLTTHAGDLLQLGWHGQPIEVFFVDFSKSWALNDVVVRDFFPCLIPGRSVVVQQDYAWPFQPWIAITMELLEEYFEPVAFAEYNSVVFVCRAPVPRDVPLPSGLSFERKLALLDSAVERFRGYPRSYLEGARAVLRFERGDRDGAQDELRAVRERFAGDELAEQAGALVQAAFDAAT